MTVEKPWSALDLIEAARIKRAESERKPRVHQISVEIADRLNRFFEEKKGRELITQEPVNETVQLPIVGEKPVAVTIYTMKDAKWDRHSFGARCLGISVEYTGQRLEIAVSRERNLLEVRLVTDPTDRESRLERFLTLAEVKAYGLLLDHIGTQLNHREPASNVLAK